MPGDVEKTICPECEEEYQALGVHWARSKVCDHAVPGVRDEAVLDGLMFIGGALNNRQRQDANCSVSIVHHDRDVLNWIADELGVLVASISEFDKAGSVEHHGQPPNQSLYDLRTRSLPALNKYYGWYDRDDNRTVPENVRVRPPLLKTACLLAGRPMDDRPGMYLSLRRTSPSPVTVHRVFGGYGPRIIRNSDGGYVLRIQNTTDLCNDLAPWPAFARDRFDAARYDEGRIVCPQCGGRFRERTHLCEYVQDGKVVRDADASPGGSREIVEVEGMRARVRTSDEELERYVSWTARDCTTALLDEYESAGRFPTNGEYAQEQEGREDLPSLSTLYARFGDRDGWLAAMHSHPAEASILAADEDPPESTLEKERRLYEYYGDRLPDKEQADVKAVIVDGESVPEQAADRSISRKVAYKNVRRGRKRLREAAKEDGIQWAPSLEDSEFPLPGP